VSNDAIKQIYQVKINELQAEVTPYERVVKFTLLPEPFSIENSAMTSTLKLRRKVIAEQYKEEIELMYSAG
jgi:long-chain acyl-CoA synthetase